MLHAHCEGMLDLSGDPLDLQWWQKLTLVTEHAAAKLRTQLLEQKYDFNLALLKYGSSDSQLKLHNRQAEQLRNQMIAQTMPWVDVGPKNLRESIAEMRNRYLQTFADPASPKGQAAIEKQLAAWKEQKRTSWKDRKRGRRTAPKR